MAQIDQISAFDEQFDVVEALYQEAENMRPSTKSAATIKPASVIQSRPVIKSRAPQKIAKSVPVIDRPVAVIDRIEDLFLEAEALREMPVLTEGADTAIEVTDAPSDSPSHDDDFGIPATFGGVDITETAQSEITDTDETPSEEAASEAVLSDEVSLDINDPLPELPELPDLPEFETATPEATTDDAQLVADMMSDKTADEESPTTTEAPINTKATSNPEDNEITRQLDDVRQAVEEAQDSLSDSDEPASETVAEDAPDTDPVIEADDTDTLQDDALLKPGPELAQFIGETVRDVLDTELPVMVRGLVNEALSERRSGYGNQAGTQIGLRTKSTKEFQ